MRQSICVLKLAVRSYKPNEDELEKENVEEKEAEADYKYDELLKQWGLEKYTEKMKEEGWDDWRDWKDLTDQDLKNDTSFAKGHIRRFMRFYAELMEKVDQGKKKGKEESKENENNEGVIDIEKLLRPQKDGSKMDLFYKGYYDALFNAGFNDKKSL
eukprot:487401_1